MIMLKLHFTLNVLLETVVNVCENFHAQSFIHDTLTTIRNMFSYFFSNSEAFASQFSRPPRNISRPGHSYFYIDRELNPGL